MNIPHQNKHIIKKQTLAGSTLALVILQGTLPFHAHAQSEEPVLMLEEVVVTAEKRDQLIKDIPSTVNALEGDMLSDYQIHEFEDLELVTAGLDMRSVDGRSGTIALRGVDYNPNSAAAQAVDVYWNDITLGSNASGGVFQQLFDIGSVVLLRGPQGTVQGRSSPAGAVKVHTAKPHMYETEGYAKTSFTDNSGNNTQFGASLPIIEGQLGLRVAGVYDESELDQTENILSDNVSDTQTKAGRISLGWSPNDEISADLVYQYLDNNLDRVLSLQGESTLSDQPIDLPQLSASDRKGIQLLPDVHNGRYQYTSLNLLWDVGDHEITFVGGYSELASRSTFDNALGNSNPSYETGFSNPQAFEDRNYASSQEVRISSLESDYWEYMVGIYHGNESGQFSREQFLLKRGSLEGIVKAPFDIEDFGVFTHNIINFTDLLIGQFGIRWQETERNTESDVFQTDGTFVQTLLTEDQQQFKGNKVTGSGSLSYLFEEVDTNLYINLASSYRPGGANVSNSNLLDLTTFNEEESWSLELGTKSTLIEGRMHLNTAIYHQDFDDYIARLNRIAINNGGVASQNKSVSITTNGDVRIQGVEAELDILLMANWRLAGGLNYTEAEYKDGVEIPCNDGEPIPEGSVANFCNVGGLEIGDQPRFSSTLNTDYTIPMEIAEAYVQVLYKFVGKRTDLDASDGSLGGYGTTDLHLGLRNEVWDLTLFAKNLFDKQATNSVYPEYRIRSGEQTGYQNAAVIPQRRLGVSASYRF